MMMGRGAGRPTYVLTGLSVSSGRRYHTGSTVQSVQYRSSSPTVGVWYLQACQLDSDQNQCTPTDRYVYIYEETH
jgi:hypothetical protein